MIIKIGKSRFSSKAYSGSIKRKIKKWLKHCGKRIKKTHISYHKNNPTNTFTYSENIEFPKDVKKILKSIDHIREHEDNFSLNLKNIKTIDNASILFLTANIDNVQHGKKSYKKEELAPKKQIDKRLTEIGFWQALCSNPPKYSDNLNYLRIRNVFGLTQTNNDFHMGVVNFFTEKRHVDIEQYKDELCDALYEAMANSTEHAFINYENSEDKKIWLLGAYDKDKKELEFIYYDIGIGIIESIELEKTKLTKILKRYAPFVGYNNVLKKLCTSDLSRHKGKKPNRGKGMMSFKSFIDKVSKQKHSTLQVTTSNLMYDSENDSVKTIKSEIKGTMIRWKIGENR